MSGLTAGRRAGRAGPSGAFLDRFSRQLEAEVPEARERRRRAWQALCQAILVSNEFVYRRLMRAGPWSVSTGD